MSAPKKLGEVHIGTGDDLVVAQLYSDWTWDVIPDPDGISETLPLMVGDDLKSPAAGEPGYRALAEVARALGGKAVLPKVTAKRGEVY